MLLRPRQPSATIIDDSPAEQEVLELLALGYLDKEITDAVQISGLTVNTYISST